MHVGPMPMTSFIELLRRSSRRCLLISLLLLGLGAMSSAHADEPWYFAHITCVPELGYFSIRRFFVMDLPNKGPYLTEGLEPGPAAVADLQRKYGIFDSKGLQDHPFECFIPSVKATRGWSQGRPGYKIQVVGHLDKYPAEPDILVPWLEVFVQDKSAGSIYLNSSENIDSIEVWFDAVLEVRTCRLAPGTNEGNAQEFACRYESFKGGAQ